MDIRKFNRTKFIDREDVVPALELAEFFKDGEKPELVVRGLTSEEALIVNESAQKTAQLAALVESLANGNTDAAAMVTEALGVTGKNTPVEHSRRLAILEAGSVNPKFDRQGALQLSTNFPTIFLAATTKILELTGMGRMQGKPKGSGKTQESEPR